MKVSLGWWGQFWVMLQARSIVSVPSEHACCTLQQAPTVRAAPRRCTMMTRRKLRGGANLDAKLERLLFPVVLMLGACAGSAHPDKGPEPLSFKPAPPPDNGPTPPGWATYTREDMEAKRGWGAVPSCPTTRQLACPPPMFPPPCPPLPPLTPVEDLPKSKGRIITVVGKPALLSFVDLLVIVSDRPLIRWPGDPPPPPGPFFECGRCEGRFAVVVEGGFTVFLAMYVEGDISHRFVRCEGDCGTMCCPFPLADDLAVTGRLQADVNSWYVVDPAMCRVTEARTVSNDGGE
jgi:hypothetical protein